jgi:hypothetical protein
LPSLLPADLCARCVLLLAVVLLSGGPALAETLVGNGIRLEQGVLRVASDPVLSNTSETLHLEGGVVGQFAAGRSNGASGISLEGGLVPTPVPEPSTGLLLLTGAFALVSLGRSRTLRSLHQGSSLSTQGKDS